MALGYTVFAAFTVLVALNEPGYVVVASCELADNGVVLIDDLAPFFSPSSAILG